MIIKKLKVSLVLVAALFMLGQAVAEIDEGIEYKLVSPPVPTSTSEKIEVVELFWYGCPHCYEFEPTLERWLASKPDNVVFVRIPAAINPVWTFHAQVYYTAEALGVLDKIHRPFFDAIHKEKKAMRSEAEVKAFFAEHGVSNQDFDQTFNSFLVNSKVNRAGSLSKRYQMDGVPAMIVNGKYRTSLPLANGREGMINVVDFLIKQAGKGK